MSKNPSLVRAAVFLSMFIASAAFPLHGVELYEDKTVRQIQVELTSNVPFDPKPILARLKTKQGDHFSQFTFDSDLKTLSEEYDHVQPSVRISDDKLYITIVLTPRPIIHEISFSGNDRYSAKKLREELDVQPYTVFNRQEFNKSFNKLKEFYIKKGYFESQLTYIVQPIANTDEVDIQIDVKEGKSGRIKKIAFNGFTKTETKDLSDTMHLKQYNFLTSWFSGTGTMRDEALEQDKMTIVNYLHNRGYADARVDIEIQEAPGTDKINVIITAHRGPIYHFGSVEIEGNQLITTEDLFKRSLVKPGETFSPEKVRETAQAIKDLYGQKGYIDANVQYETQLQEEEPVFNVQFIVDEGEQYKIGLVHIFGNHSTQSSVILRESLLVPGETFDSRKLKATQQRLEGVGYFKSVNVYAVRTVDDLGLGDNYRDVYVEVEETSTGNISLFMGFSSVDDVFGGLELSERNFNLAGVPKVLGGKFSSLRGGGQYFHIRATLGKKQDNILVSWVNPYVYDTLWRLGVELSRTYSELQSDNVPVRTYGGSVFANYPLSTYWTYGMRERLRHTYNSVSVRIEDKNAPKKIKTVEDMKQDNETKGLLSGFSMNLAYDSTDHAGKPHRGWRSYLEAEIVGIGGKYHFGKFSYLNSIYFPIRRGGTFKIRGELKFIQPFGHEIDEKIVPYSERFFLGGEGTVRGYKPFILGTKFYEVQANGSLKRTNTPKGGLSSLLLSAEYVQSLVPMIDVFAFFDAGSVSFDKWSVPTPQCAYGFGTRLEIAGRAPIILGYGIPINAKKGEKQKFFFSMGGSF